VDIVLVGDSLGMVVMGLKDTVAVTMEDMLHHAKAVARGCKRAFLLGDMPFMSYNTSIRDAIINAGRMLKEGGCDGVKLEGGLDFVPTVEAIVKAGIPVQGHVGLTPQTAGALGGYRLQGKDAKAAMKIIDDAKALEDAGVFSIILEKVPAPLGKLVAESVQVPIIGIGAGKDVDGQVLVTHDLLGIFDKFIPKFVKQYAQIRTQIVEALNKYKEEVLSEAFPGPEHSFSMSAENLEELKKQMKRS